MKKLLMTFAASLLAVSLLAAVQPDFSGSWQFAPKESRNAGMMAGISMLATITQTGDEITIAYDMAMEERRGKIVQRFDLSGKPVDNPTQMGGRAETTSQLTESELVTTWTTTAPSGATLARTETWSLSPDGKLLTITSVRGNGAPVVLAFERR